MNRATLLIGMLAVAAIGLGVPEAAHVNSLSSACRNYGDVNRVSVRPETCRRATRRSWFDELTMNG